MCPIRDFWKQQNYEDPYIRDIFTSQQVLAAKKALSEAVGKTIAAE